jgi:RNA polymerase sigma factor (sigma-70 family)
MNGDASMVLSELLAAGDSARRDAAWDHLVGAHSGLLLKVARSFGGGHDAVMDRYAHVLDQLRRDDFHRLRAYVPRRDAQFTTWLVVVVRRLCLDHGRERFGRARTLGAEERENLRNRRLLANLAAHEIDLHRLPDPKVLDPVDRMAVRAGIERLQVVLARLGDEDRLILKWRFEDDVTLKEIARLMHLRTTFHAYRRIQAILRTLRRALEDSGLDSSRG